MDESKMTLNEKVVNRLIYSTENNMLDWTGSENVYFCVLTFDGTSMAFQVRHHPKSHIKMSMARHLPFCEMIDVRPDLVKKLYVAVADYHKRKHGAMKRVLSYLMPPPRPSKSSFESKPRSSKFFDDNGACYKCGHLGFNHFFNDVPTGDHIGDLECTVSKCGCMRRGVEEHDLR